MWFVHAATLLVSLSTVSSTVIPARDRFIHPSTHSTRSLPNGFTITTFHPPSSYEVYDAPVGLSMNKRSVNSYADAAVSWMKNKHGNETTWRSNFRWPASSHVYAKQHINGIPIANTLASVTLDSDANLIASSSSFLKLPDTSKIPSTATISAKDAVDIATDNMNAQHIGVEPALKYFAVDPSTVVLTHAVRLQLHDTGEIMDAHVDATTGEVVGMIQWTSHLSMRVVPLGKFDPRTGTQLIVNPEDKKSSPYGWNNVKGHVCDSTVGNNAWAFTANLTTVYYANSTSGAAGALEALVPSLEKLGVRETSSDIFNYTYNLRAPAVSELNRKAATVNAWYVANRMHDILYRYGFTEKSFNFELIQGDNGIGGDPVMQSIQDALDVNNSFFATLEDGIPGLMSLFIWNATVFGPDARDSAIMNDIVSHEYGHGLSNRLTGGGTAVCIQTNESKGLGEGWSDSLADWIFQIHQNSGIIEDYSVAPILYPGGIRRHVYSTNRTTNPLMYSSLAQFEEPHDLGEIWAETLHLVHSMLVTTLGTANTYTVINHPEKENGHSVWMHLLMTSLATQPCNPTFLQARKAWIDADRLLYKAKNTCNLWHVFASMGFGTDAHDLKDGSTIPIYCPPKIQSFVTAPSYPIPAS